MPKEKLNELDGKNWLQFSFSIWKDIRKSADETKLSHPAMFPMNLALRLIEIYTKRGEFILDPFMGIGSTVLAATQIGRKGIGIELSESYFNTVKERMNKHLSTFFSDEYLEPLIINDDSRNLLKYVDRKKIDLCITSPPYWDILNQRRTADRKKINGYSESHIDLGNISDYNEFLTELQSIFLNVRHSLKINGHLIVIVMDIRKKNVFFPLHSDFADKMKEINFKFEDIIIWDRQHEYNNMRPLGYPYVFRVNKVHEYILIFKKESE